MSYNYEDEKKSRSEVVLRKCEIKEHHLHKKLSLLLNELCNVEGVSIDTVTEIEDIYIQKGIVYSSFSYYAGLEDAKKFGYP